MLPDSTAATLTKARDYLSSGRVRVVQADDTGPGIFVASVAGDSGAWTVFRGDASGRWHCDCPAGLRGRACAHALATALVAG
jgi:uncharacterized Zn finger protein